MDWLPDGGASWFVTVAGVLAAADRAYWLYRKRFRPHLPQAPLSFTGRVVGRFASNETLLAVARIKNESLRVQLEAEQAKNKALQAQLDLLHFDGSFSDLPDTMLVSLIEKRVRQSRSKKPPSISATSGSEPAT